MTSIVENQVDVDLFNEIQKPDGEIQSTAPQTNPSLSFIEKCLHPPTAVPNFVGLPTNDARTQAVAEWRNITTYNASNYLNFTSGYVTRATGPVSDIAFLRTNGMRVLSIPFVKYSVDGAGPGVNWWQDLNNVVTQDNYNFNNAQADMQLFRPVYRSTTDYLNATAFNDIGMVTVNQFNPSILFSGAVGEFFNVDYKKAVNFVKSMVSTKRIEAVGPKHPKYDDHLCNYHKLPPHVRNDLQNQLSLSNGEVLTLDPDLPSQILNLGGIPVSGGSSFPVPSASQVLQQSMRSYGGKARDGAFTVQRLNTIAPRWLTVTNTVNSGDEIQGLYQCWVYYRTPDGADHFTALLENAVNGTPISGGLDTLLDTLWTPDMTFSWVQFNGIQPNLVFGTGNPMNNTIIQKFYTGYEIQPSLSSAFSAFVRNAPKPDLMALQALMDGFYELKDGMPAKYNFLGVLGQMAARGLKTFGSSLLNNLFKKGRQTNRATNNRGGNRRANRNRRVAASSNQQSATVARPRNRRNRGAANSRVNGEVKDIDKQVHAINRKFDEQLKVENIRDKDTVKPQRPPKQNRRRQPLTVA